MPRPISQPIEMGAALRDSIRESQRLDGYHPTRRSTLRPEPYAMWQSFEETYHNRRFSEFSCWLTGADRARKEITLSKLNAQDRMLYDASMKKEWDNWRHFDAVSVVDEAEIAKDTPVITTRWVHTDKNALAKQAGKKVPVVARSRLVVHGHKEVGNFRSGSPTASLLAFNLLCSIAATKQWPIAAGDAPNA